MLLVAADTSGKNGSIALARAPEFGNPTPDRLEILEVVPLEGGTFSAQLIPQIAALLSRHGFRKEDVAGYAVASGPGSFTGLRVGLAAIKALGEVTGNPIAAVSLLEVLALLAPTTGHVIAALDAGRGEAYAGEYRIDEAHHATMVNERLLTRNEFVEAARGLPVITADTGLADLAGAAGLVVTKTEPLRSDAIARLGWTMLRAKRTVSPEDLEANYIRRSDAEIFSKPPER
jgi:tRNA threonylcarbamoyladenosine biosynthesis protein TsaB